MSVAFTRTNQFILGQGVMLITGDLTITTSAASVTPAQLGVKKFVAVLGSVFNGSGELVCPTLSADGLTMTCAAVVAEDTQPQPGQQDIPVGEYERLAFLAV